MLQEIICEPGNFEEHSSLWTLVFGKKEGEWRGEGVAYLREHFGHVAPHVQAGAVSIALTHVGGGRTGVMASHMPHHATVPQARQLLTEWGDGPHMQVRRVMVGADMNETLRQSVSLEVAATTSRGEEILEWMHEHNMFLPDQQLATPTYHPYNTRLTSRRLDYLLFRGMGGGKESGRVLEGSRDMAQSDHDALVVATTVVAPGKPKRQNTWGPRVLKTQDEVAEALQRAHPGGDPHSALAQVARDMTVPAPRAGEPWRESDSLKLLRRAARQSLAPHRRDAWKRVWKQLQRERKEWMRRKVEAAAMHNWGELRSLGALRQRKHWDGVLIAEPDWETKLKGHFTSIFARAPADVVRQAMDRLRGKLRYMCKHTPWRPFTDEELESTSAAWGRRKATGTDSVALEALQALKQHEAWRGRVRWLLDDFLYTGILRGRVGDGVTVLLPKVHTPLEWGDTRPITLSTTLLKWMSQLLLNRGASHLTPLTPHQWAWRGKQAEELLLLIRRLMQTAEEWHIPFWVVKLDIRKAFDSVYQQSLGAMVAYHVGEKGGMPWEAHAWLSLLQSQRITVAAGGKLVDIEQTTGVRQGAPDAPVLFAAHIGRALLRCLPPLDTSRSQTDHPPCPTAGGAFMDDTYLWDESPDRLQRHVTQLEQQLRKDGLEIHGKKVAILTNGDTTRKFRVGKAWVTPGGAEDSFQVLGSPVAFRGLAHLLGGEMAARARRAFWGHKAELTAGVALKPRLGLHLTYVRPAALWGASAWPIQENLLKMANTQQLQQIQRMLGLRRKHNESWASWHQRTMRLARAVMHREGVKRWSTRALERIWQLHGHVARQQGATHATMEWRGQEWWRMQQRRPRGVRHPQRFNPHMNTQRQIASVAGDDWLLIAQDRTAWQSLQGAFLEKFDPRWASGRQPSLQNLAPTRGGPAHQPKPRGRRKALRG